METCTKSGFIAPSSSMGQMIPPSFPNCICDNCRRALFRWYKDTMNNKKAVLGIKIHKDFILEDSDVEIDSLISAADELANQHKFQKWKQDSGDVFYVTFDPSTMAVDRCIAIFRSREWKITIKGQEQKPTLLKLLSNIPSILTPEHLPQLFKAATSELCVGNPDFANLMKRQQRLGKGSILKATVEEGHYVFNGKEYNATIRKNGCTFLPDINSQCPECNLYRTDLQSIKSYEKKKETSPTQRTSATSHVPHENMTTDELKEKLGHVQRAKRNLVRRNNVLQKQMNHLMKTESMNLMGDDAVNVQALVEEHSNELNELLEENTPQKLLWESQKEAMKCSKNNPRTMRWHPAVLRWCIALHNKSPAAYRAIRDSRFIILPHENTINDYVHYTDIQPGFHGDFIIRLLEDANMLERPEHERHVTLAFDEIKIKSGLAYSAHSGKILGFTEVGPLNEELKAFERKCKGETDAPLASHMLVLMVRGITSELQKPLAYFPCEHGFLAYELYNVLNEAVELLEFAGLSVHCLVSDGASSNRKLYNMLRNPDDDSSTIDGTTFATDHVIRRGERLFFFSDVPHLIKTTRNNVENSGGNQNTRNLMVSI